MGMTPQYFAASSVYTDQLVPGKGALLQTFSTWHPNTNLNTQIQIKNLTPTLERRCNFSRRDWELFFLLSPGETRSRLSYDHSRISRRERDSILLLSCFETRSRLQKIISRGRARKNEADSRREFPGSRILADLWFVDIADDQYIQILSRWVMNLWPGALKIRPRLSWTASTRYLYQRDQPYPSISTRLL